MVEHVDYASLDMGEIGDHTVGVELARAAFHSHDPVVAMQCGAFAFVVELEPVCGAYLQAFLYVVHSVLIISWVRDSGLEEGFASFGACAAASAVLLATLVAGIGVGVIHTKTRAAGHDVGFRQVGIGG